MPRYDFIHEPSGEVIERVFSMKNVPRQIRHQRRTYHLCIGAGVKTSEPGAWPQKLWADGVLPEQREEAMAISAERGCPTYYDNDGDPVMESRGHRKRFMEAHKRFDKNAGYGDRAKP